MDNNTIEILSETYVLTSEGILLVKQICMCMTCRTIGVLYINMSLAEDDTLPTIPCPICGNTTIEIITYKLLEH